VRRLVVLLRTLPVNARLARVSGDEMPWTMETELLARTVDELGLLTADHRRKKPPEQVRRPASMSTGTGLRSVLDQAARSGRIRVVE
jgi:hypothetical protein